MSKITTKLAIGYAFKELLLEKPLNKVNVSDITERCGISRQTFYYHFKDIIDLVEWISIYYGEKILNDKTNSKTWQDAMSHILDLMKKDKVFVTNIYHHSSKETLRSTLYRIVYPVVYDVIDEICGYVAVSEQDKVFYSNFYMYSIVSVVLEWLKNDMKEEPINIVNSISKLISGSVDRAIRNI